MGNQHRKPSEPDDWTREAFAEPIYDPRIDLPMAALRAFPRRLPLYELPADDWTGQAFAPEGGHCPVCGRAPR
jgi:hypothetical protein